MIIDQSTTDADLLAAWAAAGDSQALGIVAHRYAPMVLGICRRHCRTAADAEDAFQVTFLILARSAGSIRSPSALPGWLHGTAYRVAARTRRRIAAIDDVPIEDIPDPREPLDRISRCHELRLLDEELSRMPEPLRAALVMHYLEGLRISQVADRLETTLGAIRGRLQRGRRELRQRLIRRGVSLGGALAAIQLLPNQNASAADLADAFVDSATADPDAMPAAEPHEIADLESLLSSSTSSASLLMKTSTVIIVSLVAAMLIPWVQGEAQPPSAGATNTAGPPAVTRLAGTPTPPAAAAFTAPSAGPAAASEGAAQQPASENRPFADSSDPFGDAASNGNPFGGKASGAPVGGQPGDDPLAQGPRRGSAAGRPSGDPFGGNTSEFTRQLERKLQEDPELQIGTVPMQAFISQLSKALEAPVFFEPYTELTGVDDETSISLGTSDMPLRLELKKALRPHAMRAVVRDDALMIIPDMTELARRGIGTDRYINVDDSYMRELEEKLAQTYSQTFNQIPLEDAVRIISQETEIRFLIDTRALEDLGLTRDVPVTIDLSGVALYSFLQQMLRESDLTLQPRDGYVLITTEEEAEDPSNVLSRAYWLDATGLAPDAAMATIESTIEPDTWQALGGPSTMTSLTANEHGRTMLVVATPYAVHREIEKLLEAVRQGVVDPQTHYPASPPPKFQSSPTGLGVPSGPTAPMAPGAPPSRA